MEVKRIVVHDLVGKPIFVNPEHIGDRHPIDVAAGDNSNGKTVLEIDGVRHEVKESMDEIDKLIKEA